MIDSLTTCPPKQFLTERLSVYLDALRFLLAFGVAASHLEAFGFDVRWLPFSQFGHESVVGFFVLSGLVISHSAIAGQKSFRDYWIARASRILSVALPAIILSIGLWAIGRLLDPVTTLNLRDGKDWEWSSLVRVVLFMSESWVAGVHLVWNGPFWSICYEVWYYVLLGLLLYVPKKLHLVALFVWALVVGPKIILLLPCWLVGLWLFRWGARLEFERRHVLMLFGFSAFFALMIMGFEAKNAIRDSLRAFVPGFWRLEFSQLFVTDFLLAICFAAHLIAMRSILEWSASWVQGMRTVFGFISKAAVYSFSLYLFHMPIMNFLYVLVGGAKDSALASYGFLLLAVGLAISLGRFTESKQAWWKRQLLKCAPVRS